MVRSIGKSPRHHFKIKNKFCTNVIVSFVICYCSILLKKRIYDVRENITGLELLMHQEIIHENKKSFEEIFEIILNYV